ncbi:glycine cleavage system protein H [Crossiella sp. CA-258035]|uniref:glycine cleavage system protein H n=1 Tax=Crossiella sp. CA-258035 TaxID=2981138 RepID=UPI0024BD387B|nr:glycine cleavage system protein H [Crossiella sp. CA-258035]WHT22929.1 glycine cleavage system protein H [Crossiella sp. CA-258035]
MAASTDFQAVHFTSDHNWVRFDGGTARIGLTACLAERLTGLRQLTLPEPGALVRQRDPCGLLATRHWCGDLFAPVTGTVTAVNHLVLDRPGLIRQEPYGAGWLFEVRVTTVPGRLLDGLGYLELTSQHG